MLGNDADYTETWYLRHQKPKHLHSGRVNLDSPAAHLLVNQAGADSAGGVGEMKSNQTSSSGYASWATSLGLHPSNSSEDGGNISSGSTNSNRNGVASNEEYEESIFAGTNMFEEEDA
jgi:hypothetical protein